MKLKDKIAVTLLLLNVPSIVISFTVLMFKKESVLPTVSVGYFALSASLMVCFIIYDIWRD